jgi:hypothetical protein
MFGPAARRPERTRGNDMSSLPFLFFYNERMITVEEKTVYLHINNGGISVGINYNDGLQLEVKATHFGNVTNHILTYVSAEGLREIGELLITAANAGYKEKDYCKAELVDRTSAGESSGSFSDSTE